MKLNISSFVSSRSYRARISDIRLETRPIAGKDVTNLVIELEFQSGRTMTRRFKVSEYIESGFYEFLKALAKLGFVFDDTETDDEAVIQLKQKLVGRAFRFVTKELEPLRGSDRIRRVDIPVEVLADFNVIEENTEQSVSGGKSNVSVSAEKAVQSSSEQSGTVGNTSGPVTVQDKIKMALSGGKALTLTELASATGVPYAELSKALVALKEQGVVVQDVANGVKLRLK